MEHAPSSEESQREDAVLVEQVLTGGGDSEACGKLVRKYWRLVVAWVRPLVQDSSHAEDVAQEAFIRAFRALEHLEERSRFFPWLMRIAHNRARDLKRRRPRTRSLDLLLSEGSGGPALLAPERDAAVEMDQKAQEEAVLRAVDRLPDRYRLVVLLRYFEGLRGNEIASLLGEPEGTVRNRLFRAHEKMRRLLGEVPAAGSGEGTGDKR